MPTIHLLPDHLIAQIAAGEVIERPAYAIKELLENSLDAGSTEVVVDLEGDGLGRITVADNGTGMSREDLLQSYLLHTTSKITDQDTLAAVRTLGFRGEALASIAAVSTLTIASRRTGDPAGTSITVEQGKLRETRSLGMPAGTRVTVERIFQHVPARKKFLRSGKTELRHSLSLLTAAALARPDIRLTVRHNGRVVFDVPPQELHERIGIFFGTALTGALLPVAFDDAYVTVRGYISRPQMAGRTATQFFNINRRPVQDRSMASAVRQAYGVLLGRQAVPYSFITIAVPPEHIDANIHPRKEQVGFSSGIDPAALLEQAVRQSLSAHNLTFRSSDWRPSATEDASGEDRVTASHAGRLLKEAVLPWNDALLGVTLKSAGIVQLHDTFLVTQSVHGVVIIDQHAAHERVLYEKFRAEFSARLHPDRVHRLPTPSVVHLTPEESAALSEYRDDLARLGFAVHGRGSRRTLVSVPDLLRDRDHPAILRELLHELMSGGKQGIDRKTHTMLTYLACRAAVKAGDRLTQAQARDLLNELEKTPGAYTCPHGRPVKFEISLHELQKLFRRT